MIDLLSLILQKEKFCIIVNPTNAVITGDTGNTTAHLAQRGDISPIGTFLAIRLQCLVHDAYKALPAKAAFAKVLNTNKAKDIWSTTSLDATGDAHHDKSIICATLIADPAHTAWYRPINMLVPRTHTS
jgi:hypothetical protein